MRNEKTNQLIVDQENSTVTSTKPITAFLNHGGILSFPSKRGSVSEDVKWITASVSFSHSECECDETEFCVKNTKGWNLELEELFLKFIEESHYTEVNVSDIEVIFGANSLEALEMLEINGTK